MVHFFLQLVVGDFGLNYEQSKAQFAFWSILAAVSFLSLDLKSCVKFIGDLCASVRHFGCLLKERKGTLMI